ncbi:glycosyltransferase [Rheinheimera sp.]|uniref:glycosyltransferase n=1 Tax=Rheinheimera sp. TaxID=1869214 RepID=UPI003AF47913
MKPSSARSPLIDTAYCVSADKASESEPLITVYIPTCNRPHLLEKALDSCIRQQVSDFEVIVVDDCSEPELSVLNKELCQRDSRVRYLRLQEPSGACVARNTAIEQAKGTFITGLDDDDEFTASRLDVFLKNSAKLQHYSFLSTGYHVISDRRHFCFGKAKREIDSQDLLCANHIGNQLFTYTVYLRDIGGFDPEFQSCQDYDCWLRLVLRFGKGLRIPEATYCLHHNHGAQRISTSDKREQGYQKMLDKHGSLMNQQQRDCQAFYLLLNSGLWSPLQLIAKSNRKTLFVALKNILMYYALRLGVTNKGFVV